MSHPSIPASAAPRATSETGVTITQQIRWGDLDALGHVNNCEIFRYCESVRIAYFERVELNRLSERATDGPGLVSASLNFRRQLRYPGTVEVECHVVRIGERSFTFSIVLRDQADGAEVANGEAVSVWVDYAQGRAMRLPDRLIDRIIEIEQNPALATGRAAESK